MAVSLKPERLKRYKDVAMLLIKYGRSDLISVAGLEGSLLPDEIVWGKKQGYSLPIKNLLRGELKDYMITVLNDSPLLRDITNRPYVNRLITEHLEQRQNHNHVLWGLMTTALWHQRFLAS